MRDATADVVEQHRVVRRIRLREPRDIVAIGRRHRRATRLRRQRQHAHETCVHIALDEQRLAAHVDPGVSAERCARRRSAGEHTQAPAGHRHPLISLACQEV